jgi:ferredoxin
MCTDCDVCREIAPSNFSRDGYQGVSYISKQPTSEEENKQCCEAMEGCPCEAIADDGDTKDWNEIPPYSFPVPQTISTLKTNRPWWKIW